MKIRVILAPKQKINSTTVRPASLMILVLCSTTVLMGTDGNVPPELQGAPDDWRCVQRSDEVDWPETRRRAARLEFHTREEGHGDVCRCQLPFFFLDEAISSHMAHFFFFFFFFLSSSSLL